MAFAIFACDDEASTIDTQDPTISISSPTSNQEFNNDGVVPVRATVKDNLGLDEVTIWVTPPGGQAQQVFTESVSDFLNDNREAEIDEDIDLSLGGAPAAGSYVITVRAIDERENMAEQSVTVMIREADDNAPTITITSPEDNASFQAGQTMVLAGMVEDDMVLSEVMVSVMSSAGTSIFDSTYTEFTDGNMLTLDESIMIPREANLGASMVTITAVDLAGNEAVEKEIPFTVTAPGARVTFMLTGVPENTPEEDLYIAGEFAQGAWLEPGSNEAFMLTDNGDGTYSTTLDLLNTTETEGMAAYKFARAGGWDTVEKDAACADIDNRMVANDGTVTEVGDLTVISWADLCE